MTILRRAVLSLAFLVLLSVLYFVLFLAQSSLETSERSADPIMSRLIKLSLPYDSLSSSSEHPVGLSEKDANQMVQR